jgi:hypothetical protein
MSSPHTRQVSGSAVFRFLRLQPALQQAFLPAVFQERHAFHDLADRDRTDKQIVAVEVGDDACDPRVRFREAQFG